MAAKIFEVDDVLPATTQLRISWTQSLSSFSYTGDKTIKSGTFTIVYLRKETSTLYLTVCDDQLSKFDGWASPYTDYPSSHAYYDVDTSMWSIEKRTVTSKNSELGSIFRWEDLAPTPSGYTITYEENGGTTQTDLTEQTALPTPLPTTTKSGYTFKGWYYDSGFTNEAFADDPLTTDVTLYAKWELNTYTITYNSNGGTSVSQATGVTTLPSTLPTTTREGYAFVAWYIDSALTTRAVAGETIEEDTTLYAKWHNLSSLFTEIADAIRSKDGTSENIRDLDFGERVNQIQGAKEITQAQYDGLFVYDDNTYYLIVEEE